MRRAIITILSAVLLVAGGIWLFFAYANTTAPQPVASTIEKAQDGRLNKGREDAPVKIVEYADVLCAFCVKAHHELVPQLQSDYIDKGLVHYELRLVAIISPDSKRAASGAYCAAEQNKFWEYIDAAYGRSWDEYYALGKKAGDIPLFSEAGIGSFASGLSLDTLPWTNCLHDDTYAGVLEDNLDEMRSMEATGTPTFLINGQKYSGVPPYAVIEAVVNAAIKRGRE